MPATIRLQTADFDATAETALLTRGRNVAEAEARWPLKGVTIIHRHGRLVPGDNIVLVATAASHRGDAFAAAEFLMDYLKTRAPFWKKEEHADGAAWVEAKSADDSATDRWTEQRPAAE
jgi:molybdopterin synthase catalytic subunit